MTLYDRTKTSGFVRIANVAIAAVVLAGLGYATGVFAQGGPNTEQGKITLCHATGAGTYQELEVGFDSGGIKEGHGNTNGIHANDIIPLFTYTDGDGNLRTYSKNWTATGQAIWNNDCVVPPAPGTIIVQKETIPDGSSQAFSFDGSWADFSLSDGQSHNSGPLTPGAYTVSETLPTGWTLKGVTCSDGSAVGMGGAIALDAGETVTCTFTNEQAPQAPATGHIIVDKVTDPAADPQVFSFDATGGAYADFTLTDAQAPNDQELAAGTYSITEAAVSGWAQTSASCTSDIQDTETPGSIELDTGETVTCTFTNTKDAVPPPASSITLHTQKIICDDETDLPNWGTGKVVSSINASTASNWMSGEGFDKGCVLADWDFQWVDNMVSSTNPGDQVGVAGSGWSSPFSGSTIIDVANIDRIWVRETFDDDYIEFGGWNTTASTSAEIYCGSDVLNYDNWEFMDVSAGNDYYCVAWNVLVDDGEEPQQCELTIVSDDTNIIEETGLFATSTFTHAAWTANIPGATWIWKSFLVEQPTQEETYTLKQKFNWTGGTATAATLAVASDNRYVARINGTVVGSSADDNNFQLGTQDSYTPSAALITAGENTIEIEVTNLDGDLHGATTPRDNPAGGLYKLVLAGTGPSCGSVGGYDGARQPEYGSITIDKIVVGENANENLAFTFNPSWSTDDVLLSGNGTPVTQSGLTAGEYSISEATTTGWTLSAIDCTDTGTQDAASTTVNLATGEVTIDLAEGQDVLCTFENTYRPGSGSGDTERIIVRKEVAQGGDTGFDFDFALVAASTTATTTFSLAHGQEWDSGDLDEGTAYSVTETAVAGWTQTNVACTSVIPGGDPEDANTVISNIDPSNIVLENGEAVTCVFTNAQNPNTFTLDVTIIGDGEGLIAGGSTTSPESIACDSNAEGETDCAHTYPAGTVIELTATPDEGSNFDSSWTIGAGTCMGAMTPCSITLNSNVSLTAHFGLNGGGNSSTNNNNNGGGSRSSSRRSSGDGDGEVAGASTSTAEVAGAQTSAVPGLPNTGRGGGAASSAVGTITILLSLVGSVALLATGRKEA